MAEGTRRTADDHYDKMLKELANACAFRSSHPDIALRTLRVTAEELCLCAVRTADPAWGRERCTLDDLLSDQTFRRWWADDDTRKSLAIVRNMTNPSAHGSGREAHKSDASSAILRFAGPVRRLHAKLGKAVPALVDRELRRLEQMTPPAQPQFPDMRVGEGSANNILAPPGSPATAPLPPISPRLIAQYPAVGTPGVHATPPNGTLPRAKPAPSAQAGPVVVVVTAAALVIGAGWAAARAVFSTGAPTGMVRVHAGTFTMGDDRGESSPAHRVTLTRDFWIDKNEVVIAQYAACVSAGYCTRPTLHGPFASGAASEKLRNQCNQLDNPAKQQHPVNCVDQFQAAAYCAFASKRLPSEAEWELAARGTDGRTYPWGEAAPTCSHAATQRSCGGGAGTVDVRSTPDGASTAGALNMAGNVWEWVADGWSTYSSATVEDPPPAPRAREGVLRGGGWAWSTESARATSRLKYDATTGHVETGFRCARSLE